MRRKLKTAPFMVTVWTPSETPATSHREFFTLRAAAIYVQHRYKQAHKDSATPHQFAIDGEAMYTLHNFTLDDVRKELAVEPQATPCGECKGYGNVTQHDERGSYIEECAACGGRRTR